MIASQAVTPQLASQLGDTTVAASLCSFLRQLRDIFRPSSRRIRQRREWAVEALEDRLTPASVSQSGTTLTFVLDQVDEQVTVSRGPGNISFTSTTAIANGGGLDVGFVIGGPGNTQLTGNAGALASIDTVVISDVGQTGASVVFTGFATSFDDSLAVSLDPSLSGGVRFTGPATFAANVSVAANGTISSLPGASLNFTSSSASLTSDNQDVLLLGQLQTAVGTSLSLSGRTIQAANATNDFAGPVLLYGAADALSLVAANNLILGDSSLSGAAGADSIITAGGNVTQNNPINVLGSRLLQLTSTGGGVTLTNPNNHFSNLTLDVATAAAGQDTSLYSNDGLNLGDVRVADQLSVTVLNGTISDSGSSSSIHVGGPASFKVDDGGTGSIDLATGPHRFGGSVTVIQGAGSDVQDVELRNTLATATLPSL